MRRIYLLIMLLAAPVFGQTFPSLQLDSPKDYQVFQRQTKTSGIIKIKGTFPGQLQYRLQSDWQPLPIDPKTHEFNLEVKAPAGGWYALDLRDDQNRTMTIEHVGVGEVFVISGQSNSTNYGAVQTKTKSGMVAAFDGKTWQLAADPIPGTQDTGKKGSFMPAFGDAMYEKYRVPIGIAACGAGSMSVRNFLPKGEKMDLPPTKLRCVKQIDGQWQSTGELFDGMMKRIDLLGPHGFRAMLWHQGESDVDQSPEHQISADDYRSKLETIIRTSKAQAGWDFPWFVAQVSYHPGSPSNPDFRAAQKSLWDNGIALQGPDTDALGEEYRAGVHFNEKGLAAHGKLWADAVSAYLDQVLAKEEK